MGERPTVVIPNPGPRDRDFVREFRPWWQQAEEKWWGKFVPWNEKYDPIYKKWYDSQWSVRGARKREGIWRPVSWLFYLGMYGFALGGIALSFMSIGIPAIAMYAGFFILMKVMKRSAEKV